MSKDDSMDLVIRAPQSEITAVMGRAEDLITRAVAENDPLSVFTEISFLRRDSQLKGAMIAKLLSDLWDRWSEIEGVTNTFEAFLEAAHAETGLSPAKTIKPYIRMWKAIFGNPKVPATIKQQAMTWATGTLLYLQPAAQDGSLDGKWKEVAALTSPAEVKQYVRELRGAQTSSSNAVRIFLQPDGILKTRRGKGVYQKIGYLDLKSDDELVKIAVNRIVNAAGVVELDH